MNPQGSSVVNTQQYDAYIDRVESVVDCKSLQEVTTGVLESIQAEEDAITSQLKNLLPLQALLDAPTTPDEVIAWIQRLITSLIQPIVSPYGTLQTQQAQIIIKKAELVEKITEKAESIGSCSIDIPTP